MFCSQCVRNVSVVQHKLRSEEVLRTVVSSSCAHLARTPHIITSVSLIFGQQGVWGGASLQEGGGVIVTLGHYRRGPAHLGRKAGTR